ncbi:MAG TPA: glycosyltransferase [Gaiellaceae bacterium]|nr:glycosyltransferase [Gaiellaceae bacterium]
MSESPRVSVIVPTLDNARVLGDCLRSIAGDGSSLAREVVVVDNGSRDETAAVVAAVAAEANCPVRLVPEPRRGSSHARNAGIAAARGEILVFADDDVVVEPGWTDALAAPFADPEVVLVGGRTVPDWPQEPPAWLANGPHIAILTLADFGAADRELHDDELPVTANCAARADRVRALGTPFSPDLGHQGSRNFGHEDLDFVERVRRGGRVVYAAGAVAHHRIDPRRMTLGWFRGRFFDLGVAELRMALRDGETAPALPRRAVRAWRVARGVRRLRRDNDRSERSGPETVEELKAFIWAGRHAELLFPRAPRCRDLIRRVLV